MSEKISLDSSGCRNKIGSDPNFNHSMYDRVDDLVDRLLQPISKNFEFHILLFCFYFEFAF